MMPKPATLLVICPEMRATSAVEPVLSLTVIVRCVAEPLVRLRAFWKSTELFAVVEPKISAWAVLHKVRGVPCQGGTAVELEIQRSAICGETAAAGGPVHVPTVPCQWCG